MAILAAEGTIYLLYCSFGDVKCIDILYSTFTCRVYLFRDGFFLDFNITLCYFIV